jgi:hypothetical protein
MNQNLGDLAVAPQVARLANEWPHNDVGLPIEDFGPLCQPKIRAIPGSAGV